MTPEQLQQIEDMAALQFTVEEVAIIVDVTPAAIADGTAAQAYLRGRLRAQAEVRRSILDMAKEGSSPAHKQFMALAESSEPELNHDDQD